MRLVPRFTVAAISYLGRRANNEDFHRAMAFRLPAGHLLFLAVADGMGGQEAGEWASKVAIEALTEAVRAYVDQANGGRRVVGLPEVLERAFALAQRRVLKEGEKPGRKGMGTTLTALLLADWSREGVVAHIGDSRAYRLTREGVRRITQDHSWVAEQVRMGLLSPQEAERHPFRNLLTRAIGLEEAKADLYPLRLLPGEGVLLTTDGLYTLVPEEEWRFGRDLQADLEALAALALRRGGGDNLTAVAVREEA
ncbi:PP2C family protein-serine/threonine phosphatase [Thermus filiformis]|uniref:Serine/threonine protein phosphatase n=1 Tax=Thermus filiformis TaxID=276 RepID=A0A0A2WSA9_THEFI|nr:protein phosphatase 2C domain-containing protein [Thermus filiformis]KGQ21637.1 serine/threonine protein phosphatase [Thermus filiformis]